jgi:hypothetical protein
MRAKRHLELKPEIERVRTLRLCARKIRGQTMREDLLWPVARPSDYLPTSVFGASFAAGGSAP